MECKFCRCASVSFSFLRLIDAIVECKYWETVFAGVMVKACQLSDMPSANIVWSSYLREHGFKRYIIPNECPDDYTVNDFAVDHPYGTFVLALNGHVVAVVDGYFYDTWDSGNEIPLYYWSREG